MTMAGYIFLPVATQEMLECADDWCAGQKAKGKTPYTVLHNYTSGWQKGYRRLTGGGCLRNLVATDKLYVLAHGAEEGSRAIGAERGGTKVRGFWRGGTMKSYSPAELARVLQGEGLLTSFVDLRVFACGSALVPPVTGETRSFAENLMLAMRARGYSLIRVTGYQGSVKSTYEERSSPTVRTEHTTTKHKGVLIQAPGMSIKVYPASSHKVTFGLEAL